MKTMRMVSNTNGLQVDVPDDNYCCNRYARNLNEAAHFGSVEVTLAAHKFALSNDGSPAAAGMLVTPASAELLLGNAATAQFTAGFTYHPYVGFPTPSPAYWEFAMSGTALPIDDGPGIYYFKVYADGVLILQTDQAFTTDPSELSYRLAFYVPSATATLRIESYKVRP